MIPASVVSKLYKLGLSDEHLEQVVDLIEEATAAVENKAARALESRRAHDRERKQRQRSGTLSRDVTGRPVTSRDSADPSPLPPGPPNPTPTPEVIPPSPPSEAPAPRGADRSRGSRISADWRLDDVGRAYAVSQGLTSAEVDGEAAKFRDHWLAKAGADGRKADWAAAWRTWARNAIDRRGRGNGPRSPPDRGRQTDHRNGFFALALEDRQP